MWTSQKKRIRTPLGSFSEQAISSVDDDDEETVKRGTLFQFPSEADAQTWFDAILEERCRYHFGFVNFPVISIGKSIEHEIQFEVAKKNSSVEKLRHFYYHIISKNEPNDYATILGYLYSIIFANFAEKDLAQNVDIFVYLLAKVCEDQVLRIMLHIFEFDASLLANYANYYLSKASNDESVSAKFPQASPKLVVLVDLLCHIDEKVNALEWAKNKDLMLKIVNYPTDSNFIAHIEWSKTINEQYPNPMTISWTQLKLFLRPTPYCGFFFLQHYLDKGDSTNARKLILNMPFPLSKSFEAVYGKTSEEDDIVDAAHFVGYLEVDSLLRAYEEYEAKNIENEKMLDLIKEVRAVYCTPLVTSAYLPLEEVSEDEVANDCIDQLLNGIEQEPSLEHVILREICGYWMQHTKEIHEKAAAPKRSQIITMLALNFWLSKSEADPNSSTKLCIGRVVAGEDRALLTTITAIHLIKSTAKHIHILHNDGATMTKDFERMSGYIKKIGLSASLNDFTVAANVTFCLQRDLCQYYRDCIFYGNLPFENTILLVDDVDELLIEKAPNSIYGKRDDELSAPLKMYFDIFIKNGENAEEPEGTNKIAWNKAKTAYELHLPMEQDKPNGYTMINGRYELLDSQGRLVSYKYNAGLEFIRYKWSGEAPAVNSKFFFQSLPYIFGKYKSIIGFSHHSDKWAENHDFLQQNFGAWSFVVPNDEFQAIFDLHELPQNDHVLPPLPEAKDVTTNIVKGQLMNELCDNTYLKYPHKEGKWPSNPAHRKLIDFLDEESKHTAEGIADFAASIHIPNPNPKHNIV